MSSISLDYDDIALWPDGTWCYDDEISDYLEFMSDDYELITDKERSSAIIRQSFGLEEMNE